MQEAADVCRDTPYLGHFFPYRSLIEALYTLNSPPVVSFNHISHQYPNSTVLGCKIHTLNGFWSLNPYCLGTWTLKG